MRVMNEAHVNPESLLRLNVTCTMPGFGLIKPDNTTGDPRLIELGFEAIEIVVGGLVKVVRVTEVEVVVAVVVHTVTVVVVKVVDTDVEVTLVVVRKVDVLEAVVVVDVVVDTVC
jgi:hypothetical protein